MLMGGGGAEGWTKSTPFNHFEQVNLVTLAIVNAMLGAKKKHGYVLMFSKSL